MSESFFLDFLLVPGNSWRSADEATRLVSALEENGFSIPRVGSAIAASSYSRGNFTQVDLTSALDDVEKGSAEGFDIDVSRPPLVAAVSFRLPNDVNVPVISVVVQRVNLRYDGETDEDRRYERESVEALMELSVQLCRVYRPHIGFGDIDSRIHEDSEHPAVVFQKQSRLPRAFWLMYFPRVDPGQSEFSWVNELSDAEVRPVDNLGHVIRLSANPYSGWAHNRFRAEARLGLVTANIEVYQRLVDYFEEKRRADSEDLARILGFDQDTIEKGKGVARAAGLADDAWLNLVGNDWGIFAQRVAIRVARREYELDVQDKDQLETLFREFVETYRGS